MKPVRAAMKAEKPMKAAMKVVKAMKAVKTAMKVKHVSKIARGVRARLLVFSGRKEKTATGLTKAELVKSKSGKIVSKKSSAHGKKAYSHISGWTKAVQQAKKALGVTGFAIVGGKTAAGKALHAKAKAIYKKA